MIVRALCLPVDYIAADMLFLFTSQMERNTECGCSKSLKFQAMRLRPHNVPRALRVVSIAD